MEVTFSQPHPGIHEKMRHKCLQGRREGLHSEQSQCGYVESSHWTFIFSSTVRMPSSLTCFILLADWGYGSRKLFVICWTTSLGRWCRNFWICSLYVPNCPEHLMLWSTYLKWTFTLFEYQNKWMAFLECGCVKGGGGGVTKGVYYYYYYYYYYFYFYYHYYFFVEIDESPQL